MSLSLLVTSMARTRVYLSADILCDFFTLQHGFELNNKEFTYQEFHVEMSYLIRCGKLIDDEN
jgi:hypothetical protein